MVAPFIRKDTTKPSEMTCLCCSCQRERTAADEWREHKPIAGQRITHGICPACLYALYPDIAPLVRPMA